MQILSSASETDRVSQQQHSNTCTKRIKSGPHLPSVAYGAKPERLVFMTMNRQHQMQQRVHITITALPVFAKFTSSIVGWCAMASQDFLWSVQLPQSSPQSLCQALEALPVERHLEIR